LCKWGAWTAPHYPRQGRKKRGEENAGHLAIFPMPMVDAGGGQLPMLREPLGHGGERRGSHELEGGGEKCEV